MRISFLFIAFLLTSIGIAQKRILTYTPSQLPIFIDKTGDTLSKALLGGLNQPQFQTLDINNDGKKDLVVHDRTGGFFMPFINTGKNGIVNYTYSPKYVSAFPKIPKGWVLFVDYDNDGKEDLWASINFRAVLFRNVTKPGDKQAKFEKFQEFLRAYKYAGYPDRPDLDTVNFASSFNNIPTIADLDGDGDVDFFSYEAGVGQMLLYRNMSKDFNLPLHPPTFDLADLCWGNVRDTSFDGVKVFNCNYDRYRKKHSGGSALLWFDNDNDGDMDLLLGNADGKNMIFMKNGKKDNNLRLDTIISYDAHWPAGSGNTPVSLNSFPAAFMLDVDGDNVKDIIVAPNQADPSSRIEEVKQVWFYKNKGSNALPNFQFEKSNFFTDEFLDHGAFTAPVLEDIDNDKDLDLIIATNGNHAKTWNKNYNLVLYRNIGTISKPVFKLEDEDLWGLSKDSLIYLNVTFGDMNGDGRKDMLAGDYFGGLTYYKNTGSISDWSFATPIKSYLGLKAGYRSTPNLVDLDKDGKLDLVIGENDGNFNFYRNTGNATAPAFTLMDDTLGNFISNEFSYDYTPPAYIYYGNGSAIVTDLDNDTKLDLVFGGEEGKVRVMKFDSYNQTVYKEDSTVLFDSAYMRSTTMDFGNNTMLAVGDLDNDGFKDIIVGNDRGGINFLKGKVEVIGISEIQKRNEPKVYPNPSYDIINIIKKSHENFDFSICDLNGKIIVTENSEALELNHTLNVSHLNQGVYILKSTSQTNVNYYTRIVISR
jgi:hypothetical protein